MCSICGFLSTNQAPAQLVLGMLEDTKHRGPDGYGIFVDGKIKKTKKLQDLDVSGYAKIGLGHARLNIIGGEDALQPFEDCSRGLSLVCNGEVYNYKEIAENLREKHTFKTKSDSEILLHLIEELYQGNLLKATKRAMQLVTGMYAFAVTDGKEIVIGRDPLGQKPIYFCKTKDAVLFCSEKKGLWNRVDKPSKIKKVNPGKILRINEKGARTYHGVNIEVPEIDLVKPEEALELYKRTLINAVKKRLRGLASNKIGVVFSGGVDSTLVAKLLKDLDQDVYCYCIGTSDSPDVEHSKRVCKDLGLRLQVIPVDLEIVDKLLPIVLETVEMNGPIQIEAAIPLYLASEEARKDGINIMFTGQAPDELFAGYRWYKPLVDKEGNMELHQRLWEDVTMLHQDTLEREDKVTMAHGVELRVPFIDRDFIRLAMRISPTLKIKGKFDKWIHREAAYRLGLPEYIAFRTKDAAQSGSGVHDLLAKLSTTRIKKILTKPQIEDEGSNYRYLKGDYGTPEELTYLDELWQKTVPSKAE